MFASVARFEFRYQVRQPIFWIVTSIFFALAFCLVSADRLLPTGSNFRNAPYALISSHLLFTLIFMFVTTAFVANPVLRDDETGFGPIIRVTRVSKLAYIYGRFAGAFAAAAVCLLSVPVASLLATFMPWLDPHTLGPFRLQDYAFSYFVMALPGIFFTAALFFTVATITRSMMWTYLSVLALTIIYLAGRRFLDDPAVASLAALLEPFGFGAFNLVTKFWTTTDRNTMLPALQGVLLWNRLIFIGLSFSLLAATYVTFSFEARGVRKTRAEPRGQDVSPRTVHLSSYAGQSAVRSSPLKTAMTILLARTRMELSQVFKSAAFPVLLVLSIVNVVAVLWIAGSPGYGVQSYLVDQVAIDSLAVELKLVTIIVAIFYAGELAWRDRQRRMHEIIDATPAPDWSFVVPKALAISLALISVLLISVLTSIFMQLFKGYTGFKLVEYLTWYILPTSVDLILLAILAMFFQAISSNKFVGWGLLFLYFISRQIANSLGIDDNLFNYAGSPYVELSTMNGVGSFARDAAWFQAYWSAFAIILLVIAYGLWRRGSETRFAPRWAQLKRRLLGPAGVVALVALLVFAGLGSYIFLNTHVWNEYRNEDINNRYAADTEKALQKYRYTPEPSVTHVDLNIVLDPEAQSLTASGRYIFENKTGAPLERVVMSWGRDTEMQGLTLEGAHVETAFDYAEGEASPVSVDGEDIQPLHDRIYRFDHAMLPGEKRTLSFSSVFQQHGFKNQENQHFLISNGSFATNSQYAPFFAPWVVNLEGESLRRKFGLVPVLPEPKVDLTRGGDQATSDITVTTSADQTPLAPGYTVSDVVKDGWRTVRFVSDTPISIGFPVVSAKYLVKKVVHKGIDLAVYYDYHTPWNVDRMLSALGSSLDYYQANFSPYQFRQLRIIEIPSYHGSAISFANTVPYAESLGFITDQRDPEKIDYVTYVTAHEVAHQWWAHQLQSADAPGGSVLSETLAQYSALMVMEKTYGKDNIRRFLKYELNEYLSQRGRQVLEEPTLEKVQKEGFIYYNKGSLAMYLLRDQLGEAAVNGALHKLLGKFAFKGAPYPVSGDLIQALRAEADPQHQDLITDIFQRVTLYDLKTSSVSVKSRSDGRFDVSLVVDAKKLYATGKGDEADAPLNEEMDIGLFTAAPGLATFDAKDVILLEKKRIHSGEQTLTFTVDRAPVFAGVDPYNKWIDRYPDDNVMEVKH